MLAVLIPLGRQASGVLGTLVMATDPETGETGLKKVVQLFRNETDEWIHLTVNGEEKITIFSKFKIIKKDTMNGNKEMKELFDYVAGKMSHDEFEAVLYINPELWIEIQSLVPEDIADQNCPFRKLWGNMQLLETENYKIKSAVTAFGYKSYLAYGLVKALILYHYPNAVCREPPDDSPLDVLEKIHMDYVGGNEVEDLIRECFAKAANRKELKKTLVEAFPCVSRKHPVWVQEPEWPAKDGVPMKFISQNHTGEKYEYTFQVVGSDEIRIVEQYL